MSLLKFLEKSPKIQMMEEMMKRLEEDRKQHWRRIKNENL